jgi:hypothetical protein
VRLAGDGQTRQLGLDDRLLFLLELAHLAVLPALVLTALTGQWADAPLLS